MDSSKRFLILYGSQTGQAQAIAEQILERAISKGITSELHCLDQTEKKFFLEKEPVFVVVVSSTGEGEPPDNVVKFWRKLRRKTLPSNHLARCKFSLLGLGDSNYTNFCNMGKNLNKRLLQLGAVSFHSPGFADDGVGLELVVEPWIDGLWSPLLQVLGCTEPGTSTDGSTGADTGSKTLQAPLPTSDVESSTSNKLTSPIDQSLESATGDKNGGRLETGQSRALEQAGGDNVGVKGLTEGDERVNVMVADADVVISCEDNVVPDGGIGAHVRTQSLVADETVSRQESVLEVGGVEEGVSGSLQRLSLADFPACKDKEALRTCVTGLSGSELSLPTVPPAYLQVLLIPVSNKSTRMFPYEEVSYGFKTAPVSMATIVGSRMLTKKGSHKTTLELKLEVPGLEYQPGDAFRFVCPNNEEEVEWLLHRLGLSERAEEQMELSVMATTSKKKAILPKHVPQCCSVRHFFSHCAHIRCFPKKAFLHLLSMFCLSGEESCRLRELSSKQGASYYSELFTTKLTDFLDVLFAFPSCCPPVDRLIELLPRLQPRCYSACSSPSSGESLLRIAFNVERLPARSWPNPLLPSPSGGESQGGWERRGLATGWLEKEALQAAQNSATKREIPIYPRNLNLFHLPPDLSRPIVMVGPGTGVSPFMGFLESREASRVAGMEVGKGWLFFGCRTPDFDHIYKEEMEHYLATGCLTYLDVAYSRFSPSPDPSSSSVQATPIITNAVPHPVCYVQDLIRAKWEEFGSWIVDGQASVYVCGDVQNMAKDVHSALLDVLGKSLGHVSPGDQNKSSHSISANEEDFLAKMREEGRYLVDAW